MALGAMRRPDADLALALLVDEVLAASNSTVHGTSIIEQQKMDCDSRQNEDPVGKGAAGGGICAATGTQYIDIKLNRPFHTFDAEEQQRFLVALQSMLSIGSIRVINKWQGSVVLRIAIDSDDADRLVHAAEQGVLADLGVVSVAMVHPTYPQGPDTLVRLVGDIKNMAKAALEVEPTPAAGHTPPPDANNMLVCYPLGGHRPIRVDLTPVESQLAALGPLADAVREKMARKLRIHAWIFGVDRESPDEAVIPVGEDLIGQFSWTAANAQTGPDATRSPPFITCKKLFKMSASTPDERYGLWLMLILAYNDWKSDSYRDPKMRLSRGWDKAVDNGIIRATSVANMCITLVKPSLEAIGLRALGRHIEAMSRLSELAERENARAHRSAAGLGGAIQALEGALQQFHYLVEGMQPDTVPLQPSQHPGARPI